MASKKKVLQKVIKKFPDSCALITELFDCSDYFQSLCEDYADCLQVIERFEISDKMKKRGYYREYEELLEELEQELSLRLKE